MSQAGYMYGAYVNNFTCDDNHDAELAAICMERIYVDGPITMLPSLHPAPHTD